MAEAAPSIISLDDVETWPEGLCEEVQARCDSLIEADREFADWRIEPDEEDAFRYSHLARHLIETYHCTRLLDHEVDSIGSDGLVPLSQDLVESRLMRARKMGALGQETYRILIAGHAFTSDRARSRAGQVCLVLGRCVFESRPWSVNNLLGIWGGEAINFTSAGGSVEPELRTIGVPTIIVAGVDLQPGWRTHHVVPNLLTCFMKKWLGEEDYGGDVFYRESVSPERIFAIWQPASEEYDQFPGLSRT